MHLHMHLHKHLHIDMNLHIHIRIHIRTHLYIEYEYTFMAICSVLLPPLPNGMGPQVLFQALLFASNVPAMQNEHEASEALRMAHKMLISSWCTKSNIATFTVSEQNESFKANSPRTRPATNNDLRNHLWCPTPANACATCTQLCICHAEEKVLKAGARKARFQTSNCLRSQTLVPYVPGCSSKNGCVSAGKSRPSNSMSQVIRVLFPSSRSLNAHRCKPAQTKPGGQNANPERSQTLLLMQEHLGVVAAPQHVAPQKDVFAAPDMSRKYVCIHEE